MHRSKITLYEYKKVEEYILFVCVYVCFNALISGTTSQFFF